MEGEKNISELVKGMSPKLNKGEYVFCTLKEVKNIDREHVICEFKENEGYTLVLRRKEADKLNLPYGYVASWITLMIQSSLEAVGFTALFSSELSKYNISCNVMAGYYHDHLFVDIKDTQKAINVLKRLSENYK